MKTVFDENMKELLSNLRARDWDTYWMIAVFFASCFSLYSIFQSF